MLILLDRDGVLNEDRPDHVKSPGEFMMIDQSAAAVARLNHAGHKVALVTNQSGVGRGLYSPEMLDKIHEKLKDSLAQAGGHLDAIFICPDAPGSLSERRKPEPGMLREAMDRFRASSGDTVMIGDALRDLQAAARVNAKRILVRTGKGASTQAQGLPTNILPVAVYETLWDAVESLLGAETIERDNANT